MSCHAFIGGCKTGVIHRLLIECILLLIVLNLEGLKNCLILSKTACLTKINDHISCIRNFNYLFCSSDFHVIPSSCNKAPKVLARYAKEIMKPSVWLEEDPVILLPIVITELS